MIIRDNFSKFCIKTYVVTPHLNCLDEGSQHMVSLRNKKNYHQMLPLISGSGNVVGSVPLAWEDVPIGALKTDGLPGAFEAELLVAVVRLSVIYLRSNKKPMDSEATSRYD